MSDRLALILIDVGLFLGILAAVVVLLVVACRLIGLGRCLRCRRAIPPWNAYCWTHSPFREGSNG